MFIQIIDIIRQRFVDRGFTEISIVDGKESRDVQANYGAGSANRVAFVPDPKAPMAVIPPTFIGEGDDAKRQLWNVLFVYDVSIAGYDPSNPDRDLAHRRRCFDIFEAVTQEIHRAYYGAYEWSALQWNDEKKHIAHGAELVGTLTLNIPIFDIPYAFATPAPVPGQPKPVEESP